LSELSEVNGAKIPALKPVFVPVNPPFIQAMAMTFIAWFSGRLTADAVFGTDPTLFMFLLCGVIFGVTGALAIFAWSSIFLIGEEGLRMDEEGVFDVQAGLTKSVIRSLSWESITGIKMEEEFLVFSGTTHKLRVSTPQLLENPDWILERANVWWRAVKAKSTSDATLQPLEEIGTVFEGETCKSCGNIMDVPLSENDESEVCCSCGEKQGLSGQLKESLKRFVALVSQLPVTHRQFPEKVMRSLIEGNATQRRLILGAGWLTAIAWLIYAGVGLSRVLSKPGKPEIDYVNLGVVFGFILLSIITAHVVANFISKACRAISLPFKASAKTNGTLVCHLCGTPLTVEGVVRRCDCCVSDNVVMGKELVEGEPTVKKSLQQLRVAIGRNTETAGRVLDGAALKLQLLIATQLFWLHIPILVTVNGGNGIYIRLSSVVFAIVMGVIASCILSMKWHSR